MFPDESLSLQLQPRDHAAGEGLKSQHPRKNFTRSFTRYLRCSDSENRVGATDTGAMERRLS